MLTTEEKPCPSAVAGILDPYLAELDEANRKIDDLYDFIEVIEALTTDPATAKRIRSFLIQQGIWQKKQPAEN